MLAAVDNKRYDRGAAIASNTLTFISADTILKPLHDRLIVEPIEVVFSRYIVVPQGKPIRGICRVAGPGVYPRQYDHREKHKRTKTWHGTVFRPTQTKVGDIIWVGGLERDYHFEQFWWGDKLHFHCRDEDVAGVELP